MTLPNSIYGTGRYGSSRYYLASPSFLITPDLGWANIDDMLDIDLNSLLSVWIIDELEVVTTAPTRYKSRNTLIFEYEGVRYKLPVTALNEFGGSTRHLWKGPTGPIDWFMLTRQSTSAVDAGQEQTWSRPTANPRILS